MAILNSNVVGSTTNSLNQDPIRVGDTSLLGNTVSTVTSSPELNNTYYNLESVGVTKVVSSPTNYSQEALFGLLNADDDMSLEIRILYKSVKIRNNPNEASTCILISNEGDAFEVTKQWKGWLYIESIRGWVKSNQIIVTKVIRPYDPTTDVDFDSGDIELPVSDYDAAAIINAIINSKYKLPSTSVMHSHKKADGSMEETLLAILLEQLIGSRDLVDKLNGKVGDMPRVPAIPKDSTGKLTLVNVYDSINLTSKLEWRLVDYADVQNVPEIDLVGEVQF